ncbi:MAG: hypothetical protein ACK56I_02815, partial [bacterium]
KPDTPPAPSQPLHLRHDIQRQILVQADLRHRQSRYIRHLRQQLQRTQSKRQRQKGQEDFYDFVRTSITEICT